ncbi:MAG: hypothetical protein JXM70_25175 [Pirellulales bacterium]|nr:hypothetical protein [Pirellulales bacterium]
MAVSLLKHRTAILLCLSVLLSATIYGCGHDNPLGRQPVSGTVTVDGQPLPRGMIRFTPRNREGTVGSGTVITDGKYELTVEKGLPAGEYVVGILAVDREESSNPDALPGTDTFSTPAKQRIPPRYNVKSELVREVNTDGPNVFDFEIKTR